jgi:hypothetical protein
VSSTTTQQETAPPRVTVADTEPGPTTLVGFTVSEVTVFVAFDRNSRELTVAPAYEAEMSADENDVTVLVVAVNVALVAPAGTVTLAGTLTRAVLLLDKVTNAPPAGAWAPRITVAVEALPPMTLLGSRSTVRSIVNKMMLLLKVSPPKVAEIPILVSVVTTLVATVNVALV